MSETVGVIGLGTMGAGIAEVFARAGFGVSGVEPDDAALRAGQERIERSTARAAARGRMTDDERAAILGRLRFTSDLTDLSAADLVIEAVPERLDVKAPLVERLNGVCGPETILATNTSSLSVTTLGAASGRPERVVGMHFFNPAPVMGLVEVVRGIRTDPEVVDTVAGLARRLGKSPITVDDRAGFVANALLLGYLNRAVLALQSQRAPREDIDEAMRVGRGLPMGPLTLLDLIGLDTACEILDTMYAQTGNRSHRAAPLMRTMVTAGLLGRKSGRGFYTYAAPGSATVTDPAPTTQPGTARPIRSIGLVTTADPAAGFLAERLARCGYEVLISAEPPALATLLIERVAEMTQQWVTSGRITATARSDTLPWITAAGAPDELKDCELIIDARYASSERTQDLFGLLNDAGIQVTLASTSATSVTDCAAAAPLSGDAGRVIGIHPVTRLGTFEDRDAQPDPRADIDLVELVRGLTTSDDTVATVRAVFDRAGVPTVTCRDRSGNLVDAFTAPYLNDAVRMMDTGYASADDIDAAMTLGCGYPVGPLALLDRIGPGAVFADQYSLYRETGDPDLAPDPLLDQLARSDRLVREE